VKGTRAQAKWYVYELVDPRTMKAFYIGKGKGRRMYDHGKPSDKANQAKQRMITSIGYNDVLRIEVARFWDERAAYQCEAERINNDKTLTNISKAHPLAEKPKTISFLGTVFDILINGSTEILRSRLSVFALHLPDNKDYINLYNAAMKINRLATECHYGK